VLSVFYVVNSLRERRDATRWRPAERNREKAGRGSGPASSSAMTSQNSSNSSATWSADTPIAAVVSASSIAEDEKESAQAGGSYGHRPATCPTATDVAPAHAQAAPAPRQRDVITASEHGHCDHRIARRWRWISAQDLQSRAAPGAVRKEAGAVTRKLRRNEGTVRPPPVSPSSGSRGTDGQISKKVDVPCAANGHGDRPRRRASRQHRQRSAIQENFRQVTSRCQGIPGATLQRGWTEILLRQGTDYRNVAVGSGGHDGRVPLGAYMKSRCRATRIPHAATSKRVLLQTAVRDTFVRLRGDDIQDASPPQERAYVKGNVSDGGE